MPVPVSPHCLFDWPTRQTIPRHECVWIACATISCSPQETLAELQHVDQGSPEWEANASQVDQVLQYFALDLAQYGIQRPSLGPEQERVRLQQTERNGDGRVTTAAPRMPTLDVGLAPLLAAGKVKVRQGPAEAFYRGGLQTGGGRLLPCDVVVLGTGYRHGLTQLLEPTLAQAVLTESPPSSESARERLPVTDGRCQSVAEPTLYFVGWDTTLAYGLSWGHWVSPAWQLVGCLGNLRNSARNCWIQCPFVDRPSLHLPQA